jgi:hypothetical protein
MKFKRTVLLAIFLVTMGLLLGLSAVQAADVKFDDPSDPKKATRILDLDIDGTFYNVAFNLDANANEIYGEFPGNFFFTTASDAGTARDAVNAALNEANAESIGEQGLAEVETIFFLIGFESFPAVGVQLLNTARGAREDNGIDWFDGGGQTVPYLEDRAWAEFTFAGDPPDPVPIGGSVTGLEGSGLILQNNGGDDETITGNGEFTFDTPLTPTSTYSVTVAIQPTNPSQLCVVENGSGTVPNQAVTNVAVTCGEAPEATVSKVAAEGDTLSDNTLLTVILREGGVAINRTGQVAFGGRDEDGTDAAFTQTELVVAEGDTLTDGNILRTFRPQGGLAISAGMTSNILAFHGKDSAGTDSVFTQAGVVAAEGVALPDTTLVDEINDLGKVAVNDFGLVAFHGKIEIEEGLIGKERFRAVFTSEGLAAREATKLPDETTLEEIREIGGVAINDFGEVAFIGRFLEPQGGADSKKAVFIHNVGVVARESTDLQDGFFLDDISDDGGVAINWMGDVAFHGDIINPSIGLDSVKAVVLNQEKVVAKVGDTLLDGTLLEEIKVSGGVAINFFEVVAFHGRTGGKNAVFTQHGLVAKEGDLLTDGTTLSKIHESAGVAINIDGHVAFHGAIDNTDAVLVGQAPLEE